MKIGKRESQRLEKRAQIIAVARQHFFELGFDGTVMSAIAAQLGGSKRTLWAHFSSKEDLFAAVIEDTTAAVRGGIDFSGAGDTPLAKLTHLARTVIERMTAPIVLQMFRLVSPLADRQPELVKVFFERGPMRTQKLIADFLHENFAEMLWTQDFTAAGKDFVSLAAADLHFEGIWGISGPPSTKLKDQRAYMAALLFLRAYARDPDSLASIEELAAIESEKVA
jgi:TetR/AcrR family transcriptional repressor of mexJK operon